MSKTDAGRIIYPEGQEPGVFAFVQHPEMSDEYRELIVREIEKALRDALEKVAEDRKTISVAKCCAWCRYGEFKTITTDGYAKDKRRKFGHCKRHGVEVHQLNTCSLFEEGRKSAVGNATMMARKAKEEG